MNKLEPGGFQVFVRCYVVKKPSYIFPPAPRPLQKKKKKRNPILLNNCSLSSVGVFQKYLKILSPGFPLILVLIFLMLHNEC